jgi:hypothetical protein
MAIHQPAFFCGTPTTRLEVRQNVFGKVIERLDLAPIGSLALFM